MAKKKPTLKDIFGETIPVTIIDQQQFNRQGFIVTEHVEAWHVLTTPAGTQSIIALKSGKEYSVKEFPPEELVAQLVAVGEEAPAKPSKKMATRKKK